MIDPGMVHPLLAAATHAAHTAQAGGGASAGAAAGGAGGASSSIAAQMQALIAAADKQAAAKQAAQQAAHPILWWMRSTWIGTYVRQSDWGFQALQSLHFLGMSLLIGVVGAIDLRVLGVAKAIPLPQLHRFLPLAFVGFGINLITGTLFFMHDPWTYYFNMSFRLKMLLILLSGINAMWFRVGVFLDLEKWGPGIETSRLAKLISAISLLLWIGVITAGRYIAFTPSTYTVH